MFKCAHISDIHFRSLKRHEEYKEVFTNLFDKINNIDLDAIFIGGDIVHSKTQGITPELIDILNWWFTSLAEIAPTYVILGNHDGLILNEDRQDAITPIINALNNDNIFLYKKSGVYPLAINNTGLPLNWCVFSCFDEKNWANVKPVKNEINIACYHGAVRGSLTDTDWEIEGEVNLDLFNNFDFGFLGDIHKRQYLDKEQRVAYPGSTIQQNYGEDIKKGFLLWEINSRHDYKSTFIHVKNPNPMITIDWKNNVYETIKFIEPIVENARYRIRSKTPISQADIKVLHHYLKNEKLAKEIVYQDLSEGLDYSCNEKSKKEFIRSLDIRNSEDRKIVLDSFFVELNDTQKKEINDCFIKTLDKIPENNDVVYNKTWSIKSMEFSNTFAYGKDNFINFDKMNGLVGIFGPNRCGKSSIPGTIMYSLFNTTDRGSIKNKDIVNTRKGHCNVKTKIQVDSKTYQVERETTKTSNKKNEINATTKLKLTNLSDEDHFDESEEQRRETEKVLRKLIGQSEDFLYTAFASQGEINTFVNEKTTARKSVLTKFLNLEIYEDLYRESREDFVILKNKIKNLQEKNWNNEIQNCKNELNLNEEKINENTKNISLLRNKEIEKRLELNEFKNKEKQHPSGYDYYTSLNELKNLEKICESLNDDNIKNHIMLNKIKDDLKRIDDFKKEFPIDDLNHDKQRMLALENKLKDFKSSLNEIKKEESRNKDQLKILEEVPCGDNFPTCKFIKNAHESKKLINDKNFIDSISELEKHVSEINSALSGLKKENIDAKIKKFNDLLNKEYKLQTDLRLKKSEIENIEVKKEREIERKSYFENLTLELKEFESNDFHLIVEKIKTEINEITNSIIVLEKDNQSCIHNIANLKLKIESYEKEKIDFENIKKQWEVFTRFSDAINKKGIPTMLINAYLPKINSEINKILNNVTNFKISLEDDVKNNNLDVYIDYGDSKRVIECASGMEKMMASIAIRVALTNISSLSRSNMFIIDEGFGALDETNVEACGKLLTSLKNYFKTILIISHVDAIKDIVDKTIEISVKGKDSYVRFE